MNQQNPNGMLGNKGMNNGGLAGAGAANANGQNGVKVKNAVLKKKAA